MAREYSRTHRIGELIMRELAQLIQQELSDPRVGMVTVSHVDVTPDMKQAKVLVTLLNSEQSDDKIAESLAGLNSASSFLRRRLASRVELRNIPELHFHYDKTLENGFRMDALIAEANKDLPNE